MMTHSRVVAIVQARMSSSRLAGKVLEPIQGEPMLAWVVDRSRLAKMVDEVVVATSSDDADIPIVNLCTLKDYPCYRGDATDVLDRIWKTAHAYKADVIVRITADCPLIDPDLIDATVETLMGSDPGVDFATTRLPWQRTYPIGLDVEACTRKVLEIAWQEAREPHQREHVMPYVYENPDRFSIVQLNAEHDYGNLRWTVDTKEDLEFVREIAARLPNSSSFRWRDILTLLEENPELKAINASVEHKTHRDVE